MGTAELYVSPDSQTSIKASIEYHFYMACNAASTIQTSILTRAPGNIIPIFRSFRTHWNCIFLMSADKRELDSKIIEETRKYLDSKFNEKDDEMLSGIKLFDAFKTELFKKNVLMRG